MENINQPNFLSEDVIKEAAEKYKTPLYIFNNDFLIKHMNELKDRLGGRAKVCYAMKANPFLVDMLRHEVPYFEVCSPGELKICKRLEIEADNIVLSGVFKEENDMEFAMNTYGITTFTIESYEQFKVLRELSGKYSININVLIRITSGNQFGVDMDMLYRILNEIKESEYIHVEGLQKYSGTQKRKPEIIEDEVEELFDIADNIEKDFECDIRKIEYGPGLFVPYFLNDMDICGELLDSLCNVLDKFNSDHANKKREIILEMGRYVAAKCGCYVSRIVDIKKNNAQNYCIIDGGINHLNYFGQTMSMKMMFHRYIDMNNHSEDKLCNEEKYIICGSLCTTADVVVKNMELYSPSIGDILVFENTGAYSVTEGIYMFLSRDMPVITSYSEENGLRLLREKFETNQLNAQQKCEN